MAASRFAKIVKSELISQEAKILTLEAAEGPLNFIGGQYVIINTNIPLPGGKIVKRAYSILSSDQDSTKFQIAVKKIGSGLGSNYMQETPIGAELSFSGPWGQFIMNEEDSSEVFVLATDTGITAALGLIQSQRFQTCSKDSRLLWLVESQEYFLPPAFVQNKVASAIRFDLKIIPSVNSSERLNKAQNILHSVFEEGPPRVLFLAGDGALLYPFRDELMARGLSEKQIKIECFFNNPFKKVTT